MENQIVDQLNFLCRERGWMVKAQTRLTNQIKAITRTLKDLDRSAEGNHDGLVQAAEGEDRKLLDTHQSAVQTEGDGQSARDNLALPLCRPLLLAMKPVKDRRREIEKEIEKLAQNLEAWHWAKDIRGIGPLGLGLIVGAAGRDLADYSNPGKLWKRFGLAPGQRRYTDKQKALEAGYNPQRRSLMYNISEALMKQNDGEYRQCYIDRKAFLMERSPEWKLLRKPSRDIDENGEKKPAKDAAWKYHQEALRYVAKRFLRNLWREWNHQDGEIESTKSA